MSLRFDQVADLIKIIDASACQELVLETTELKLVVRRGSVTPSTAPGLVDAPDVVSTSLQASSAVKSSVSSDPGLAPSQDTAVHQVRSPMVGTFYRAPSPDSPPFVDVGTKVASAQPLCVIEVMKLFTTIYADVAGEIKQIGASNGELVEYGRVLFVIDPDI
jgi:acetyl-CoA carboxylase biotin carboxyl carrier protein